MRFYETLLLISNCLVFFIFLAPLSSSSLWLRYFVPVMLLMAVVQIVWEGSRWQLIPAYIITGLLLVSWLMQSKHLIKVDFDGSWLRIFLIGVGLLGMIVAILLPTLFPVFRLPSPNGPYSIGTLTYHWQDGERMERYTENPADFRELMVQIWYPAKKDRSSDYAPYIQDARIFTPLARLLNLPGFVFEHFKYITTNAIEEASVAEEKDRYPVLIFSHGRGGFRQHNTAQIEELVANGYIVAAVDHTYASSGVLFPDGHMAFMDPRMLERNFIDTMIPYLAEDAIFTLNQLDALNRSDPNHILTGKLDLEHVGIFGLSLGGEVAAEASRIEPRFRACLVMDVWMPVEVVKEGLQQPTMWLTRDEETMKLEGWSKEDIDETLSSMRLVFDKLPTKGYFVQVPGMFHQDFSDAPLFSPLTSWLGITGPIDKRLAHDVVSHYSLAFFDRHLRGFPSELLGGESKKYPFVVYEMHTP